MRILYLSDTFLPSVNGIVTFLVNFSEELTKRGHEVTVFTSKMAGKASSEKNKKFKVYRFASTNKFIHYPDFRLAVPTYLEITKLIKKLKPDIIHAQMPSLLAWNGLICAKVLRIPFIGTYQTLLTDFINHSSLKKVGNKKVTKDVIWFYTRLFYNRCDMVISPSKVMKRELVKRGIKNVVVLSNSVDLSKFHPMVKKNSNEVTILHVGRLSYEKSVDVLIEAFSMLCKKRKNVKLVIIGDGKDIKKLKKQARKLILEKRIVFKGAVDHQALPLYYASADVFATASAIETEGIVVLEAMACSLPVVGVDQMGVKDLIKNGYNGYLAKPGNAKDLAAKLDKIVRGRKRKKMGENALHFVKRYDIKKCVDRIEKMYKRVKKK